MNSSLEMRYNPISFLPLSILIFFNFSEITKAEPNNININSFQVASKISADKYRVIINSETLTLSESDLLEHVDKKLPLNALIIFYNATLNNSPIRPLLEKIEISRSKLTNVKTYYVDASRLGIIFRKLASYSYVEDNKDYIKIANEGIVLSKEEDIQNAIDQINRKYPLESIIFIENTNSNLNKLFVKTLENNKIKILPPDNKLKFVYTNP